MKAMCIFPFGVFTVKAECVNGLRIVDTVIKLPAKLCWDAIDKCYEDPHRLSVNGLLALRITVVLIN